MAARALAFCSSVSADSVLEQRRGKRVKQRTTEKTTEALRFIGDIGAPISFLLQ